MLAVFVRALMIYQLLADNTLLRVFFWDYKLEVSNNIVLIKQYTGGKT